MDVTISQKSILLIDDDINIRLVIKKILRAALPNTKVYTSDKGPEGLGLAYILKPNIIILDTTLPKYSGREIVDFVITNQVFKDTRIIVLHEDNDISNLRAYGYATLSKNNSNFTQSLVDLIKPDDNLVTTGLLYKLKLGLGERVIFFANLSDNNITAAERLEATYFDILLNLTAFFFNQIFTSYFLTFFLILTGRGDREEELERDNEEFEVYRGRVYPTFIIGASIVGIIVIALVLIILS